MLPSVGRCHRCRSGETHRLQLHGSWIVLWSFSRGMDSATVLATSWTVEILQPFSENIVHYSSPESRVGPAQREGKLHLCYAAYHQERRGTSNVRNDLFFLWLKANCRVSDVKIGDTFGVVARLLSIWPLSKILTGPVQFRVTLNIPLVSIQNPGPQ